MLKDDLVDTSSQQINKDMQEDLLLLHAAQKNIEAAIIALEHYLERCIWKPIAKQQKPGC